MKKLIRLISPPQSSDLIELSSRRKLKTKMLELSPLLQISLTKDALEKSLVRQKKAELSMLFFYALFMIFSALLVLVSLAGMIILSSVHKWKTPDTPLTILLMTGVILVVAIFGYKMTNRIVRATTNPLHSMIQTFESGEMDERWSHFHDWARASKLEIYIKLASSEYIAIPVEIWEKDYVVCFIFGTKKHRIRLVNRSHDDLEALVCKAEDWKRYQETSPEVHLNNSESAQTDKNKAPQRSTQNIVKTNLDTRADELTLRQKIRGKGTSWCPRLEVICGNNGVAANKEYMKLAWNKSKNMSLLEPRLVEVLSKAVLNTLAVNFDRLDEFFGAKPASDKEKQDGQNLETKIRIDLNATEKHPTRVDDLRKRKWVPLEQYLEKLEFMTNKELYELNPKFQREIDSTPLGKKFLS